MEDALRGYTAGPAIASGRAGVEGQLTPGARADFVAWSADPLEAGVDPLQLRAVATVVGGALVHG
jgi:predicted amidohydrolase YtcJ